LFQLYKFIISLVNRFGEFDVSPFREMGATSMTEIAAREVFQRWPLSEMNCLKGNLGVLCL